MKTYLSILLAGVLVVGLVGCGGKTDVKETTTAPAESVSASSVAPSQSGTSAGVTTTTSKGVASSASGSVSKASGAAKSSTAQNARTNGSKQPSRMLVDLKQDDLLANLKAAAPKDQDSLIFKYGVNTDVFSISDAEFRAWDDKTVPGEYVFDVSYTLTNTSNAPVYCRDSSTRIYKATYGTSFELFTTYTDRLLLQPGESAHFYAWSRIEATTISVDELKQVWIETSPIGSLDEDIELFTHEVFEVQDAQMKATDKGITATGSFVYHTPDLYTGTTQYLQIAFFKDQAGNILFAVAEDVHRDLKDYLKDGDVLQVNLKLDDLPCDYQFSDIASVELMAY